MPVEITSRSSVFYLRNYYYCKLSLLLRYIYGPMGNLSWEELPSSFTMATYEESNKITLYLGNQPNYLTMKTTDTVPTYSTIIIAH